jgi:hypothetical protein
MRRLDELLEIAKRDNTIGGRKIHPLANAFPVRAALVERLAARIMDVGQRRPIVLLWCSAPDVHDGDILEGRHRALACELAGIEPRFRVYDGPDDLISLAQYVEDENLERRDLTQHERLHAAEELARVVSGERKRSKTQTTMLDADLDARIREDACAEVLEALANGQITKEFAAKASEYEPETQIAALEKAKQPKQHKAVTAADQWLPPITERLSCIALCVRCSGKVIEHRFGLRCSRCGPLVQWRK